MSIEKFEKQFKNTILRQEGFSLVHGKQIRQTLHSRLFCVIIISLFSTGVILSRLFIKVIIIITIIMALKNSSF